MARLDRATQQARVRAAMNPANSCDIAEIRPRQLPPMLRLMGISRTYWVYILASGRNGTLYVGVTNDLLFRVWQHRTGMFPGFTTRYAVKHLVCFETFDDIAAAIHRETRLKKWNRKWKLDLIEARNPDWDDLYEEMMAPEPLPDWLLAANG
jgi:putative endonuclease